LPTFPNRRRLAVVASASGVFMGVMVARKKRIFYRNARFIPRFAII
jgi:hypothetical protein